MSSRSKNFMTLLLFLSGTASVISLLASTAWLNPTIAAVLRQGGPILFVAILAWTLRTGVAALETIEQRQQKLLKDVEDFGKAERHGHAIQDLQSLSENMKRAGTIHAASSVFLRLASTDIPSIAGNISAYQNGGELHISESYIVSNVLAGLADNLPARCVWLGTSRLVAGWDEAADPSFKQFTNQLDRLAKQEKIRIFRVYCVHDRDLTHVENVVSEVRRAGAMARVRRIDAENVADVSIIMELDEGVRMDACKDPHYAWTHGKPVYGMEFDVIGGALVQSVHFVAPDSTRFRNLVNTFMTNWDGAEVRAGAAA